MSKKGLIILSLLVLPFGFTVIATATTAHSQPIEIKNYGGISYISGGIGLNEREALEDMGRNYDLKLVFSVQQGNFVSNVKVMITGSGGNVVLDAVSSGPWFYAQLPSGTYQVSATARGRTIQKTAKVTSGTRTQLNFAWAGS